MNSPAPQFSIDVVEWIEEVSRQIRWDRMPPEPHRVGVRRAQIVCNGCGETWHATKGSQPGQFRATMTTLIITCPDCNAEATVEIRTLL